MEEINRKERKEEEGSLLPLSFLCSSLRPLRLFLF